MASCSTVKITFSIVDANLNDEQRDRLTQLLEKRMREIKELNNVSRVSSSHLADLKKIERGSGKLPEIEADVELSNLEPAVKTVAGYLFGKTCKIKFERNGEKLDCEFSYSTQQELSVGLQEIHKMIAGAGVSNG